jgi:hypothetical protein
VPALIAGIDVLDPGKNTFPANTKTWIAGTRPAMAGVRFLGLRLDHDFWRQPAFNLQALANARGDGVEGSGVRPVRLACHHR